MESVVKIGTSGYSFNDWIGAFYPEGIEKGKMLDFYKGHFDTVEINSTYYGIPNRSVFYHLSEKTPDAFEFIVKLNRESTHTRKNGLEAVEGIKEAVLPLIESGKLKGLLAQFPYSFKNAAESRKYLVRIKERCDDIPLFVEFRHIGWVKDAVFDFLKGHNIGYCCVDEPNLKGLLPPQETVTTDTGYVRFHGRNTQTWWDSSKGDRYDYLYKEEELAEWLKRIRSIREKVSKTYLFFNNCHQGHAVKNAKMLIEMLKKQTAVFKE